MRERRHSDLAEFGQFQRRVSRHLERIEPEILGLAQEEYGSQIKALLKADFPNMRALHTSHFTFDIDKYDDTRTSVDVKRVDLDPNQYVSIQNIWIGPNNRIRYQCELIPDFKKREEVDIRQVKLEDRRVNFDSTDFMQCLAAERIIAILQHELIKRVALHHGSNSDLFNQQESLVRYFAQACKEYPLEMRYARVILGNLEDKSKVIRMLSHQKLISPVGRILSIPNRKRRNEMEPGYKPRKVGLKGGMLLEINERRQMLELVYP